MSVGRAMVHTGGRCWRVAAPGVAGGAVSSRSLATPPPQRLPRPPAAAGAAAAWSGGRGLRAPSAAPAAPQQAGFHKGWARARWRCVKAASSSEAEAREGGPLPEVPTTVDAEGNAPPSKTPWVKFCCNCGGPLHQAIPPDEDQWRSVCAACGRVDYQNPKMVAGCAVFHEGKVLLCRRGIEPCKGLWTLPAGYVELGESVLEGAARETWEEVNARVENVTPYFHLDIPKIGQSYIIYRADLKKPYDFSPGPETLEAALFDLKDVPFGELAFSSMTIVLQQLVHDHSRGTFGVHSGVIHKKDGFSPSDPNGYELRDHLDIPTSAPTAAPVGSSRGES